MAFVVVVPKRKTARFEDDDVNDETATKATIIIVVVANATKT